MTTLANGTLAASVALLTMIFGASVFELVVLVPQRRQPEGLVRQREMFRHHHPGHFYQVLAPIAILVSVAALALSWPGGGNPVLAAGPLAAVVLAEVFTLVYFMPLNRQLFFSPVEAQPGDLSRALALRWERANVLRLVIVAAGLGCGFAAVIQRGA